MSDERDATEVMRVIRFPWSLSNVQIDALVDLISATVDVQVEQQPDSLAREEFYAPRRMVTTVTLTLVNWRGDLSSLTDIPMLMAKAIDELRKRRSQL